MPEIIIMGLSGNSKTLPMTASKEQIVDAILDTPRTQQSVFNVEFAGDYFTLTTTVTANNDEEAMVNANRLLMEHYGLNIEVISNDISVMEIAQ